MNDIVVSDLNILRIISPKHNRSVLGQRLFHLIPPIHLELSIILDPFGSHEGLYSWPQVPTGTKHFITTQVNVWSVSEQVIDFLVHFLGKLVDCGFWDVELAVVALAAGTGDGDILLAPFFVKAPSSYVGWGIDFGHDSDAILFGKVDKWFGLVQSIKLAKLKGTRLSKFGMRGQLKSKRLIITQVPMQDIKFREWHGLNKFGNSLNFEEMPYTINHNTSMWYKGFIFNDP
jgi:hypothetical protein